MALAAGIGALLLVPSLWILSRAASGRSDAARHETGSSPQGGGAANNEPDVAVSEPPRRCADKNPIPADLDSDGRKDFVYYAWSAKGAILGACMSDGSFHKVATPGQTELLSAVDIEADGRDEIFYGGTTAAARMVSVAVVANQTLGTVAFGQRNPVVLVDGLDPGFWGSRKKPSGGGFGCEDADGDGVADLVQVSVTARADYLTWTRRTFEIREFSAVLTDRTSGRREDDPERPDRFEVVEVARELVTPCVESNE